MEHINFKDDNSFQGSINKLNSSTDSPVHETTIHETTRQFNMKDIKKIEKKYNGTVFRSKQKLEDSYMKSLMTIIYGFSEESTSMEMITQKRISLTKEYVKFVDSLIGLLVFLNILLATTENEIFYNNKNTSTSGIDVLRMMIFLISLSMASLVYVVYLLRLKIEKMQMRRLQDDGLVQSKLVYPMLLEMFICLIHCPMRVDGIVQGKLTKGRYSYSWDSIIFVLQLLKTYLFLRLWLHHSMWTRKSSQKTLSRFKVKPTLRYALKAELKFRPVLFITGIFFITIFILGLAVKNFERSYVSDSPTSSLTTDIANAWWLMIITMTTVGFGDLFPLTHLGRSICIIACVLGQLLLSLLVVALSNSAEFNQEESKAYHILKEMEAHAKMSQATELNENEYRSSQIDNQPLDEMLKNLNVKISTDIEHIKVEVDKLHELEIRLEHFQLQQNQTSRNMDQILKLQANVSKTLQKKLNKK